MRINFVSYQVNEISADAGMHPLCRKLLKSCCLVHMAEELLLEYDYNQTAYSVLILLPHSGCIQLFDHGPLGLLYYLCTKKIISVIALCRAVESLYYARFRDQECECLPQLYRQYYSTVMIHCHPSNSCTCLFLRREFTIHRLTESLQLEKAFKMI